MGGQWDNNDIVMIMFWSRSSPFSPLPDPVPCPARLRPPSPHSVHRAWHRRGLGMPRNGPRFAPMGTASEDAARLPGGAVDQAGAALYGLPPALAVQRLHIGLGHHHLRAGGAHSWLVLGLHRSAEKSTRKRNRRKAAPQTWCWSLPGTNPSAFPAIPSRVAKKPPKLCRTFKCTVSWIKSIFSLTNNASSIFFFCRLALPDRQRRVHLLQRDGGRVPPQSGVLPAGQRRLHLGWRPDPGGGARMALVEAAQTGQEGAVQQRARGLRWVLRWFWAFVWGGHGGGWGGGGRRVAKKRIALSAAAPCCQLTPPNHMQSSPNVITVITLWDYDTERIEWCSCCLSVQFSTPGYDS